MATLLFLLSHLLLTGTHSAGTATAFLAVTSPPSHDVSFLASRSRSRASAQPQSLPSAACDDNDDNVVPSPGNENRYQGGNNRLMDSRSARISLPLSTLLTSSAMFLSASTTLPSPAAAGFGTPEPYDEARKLYFPGSLKNSVASLRIESRLLKRGYKPKNTVVGACLSPDDRSPIDYSLAGMLGKTFVKDGPAGVIPVGCDPGGIPSDMKAGLATLASACPKKGNVVVVFGPHVGITMDGKVGCVEKIRYRNVSLVCSPAVEERAKGKGGSDDKAIVAATKQMYKTIRDEVEKQVAVALGGGGFWDSGNGVSELTLVGGITINRAKLGKSKGEDCFYALSTKILTAKGTTIDLFEEAFGDMGISPQDRE